MSAKHHTYIPQFMGCCNAIMVVTGIEGQIVQLLHGRNPTASDTDACMQCCNRVKRAQHCDSENQYSNVTAVVVTLLR